MVVFNVPIGLEPRIVSKKGTPTRRPEQSTGIDSLALARKRFPRIMSGLQQQLEDESGLFRMSWQSRTPFSRCSKAWLSMKPTKQGCVLDANQLTPSEGAQTKALLAAKENAPSGFTSGLFQQETELDNPLGQKQPSPFQRPFPKLWI